MAGEVSPVADVVGTVMGEARGDEALLPELIGQSRAIHALRQQVARLMLRRAEGTRRPPVLIEGDTGTGKGLLAHVLHRAGPRASGPFVDVNCAAIPETLLEAELFGYERGAFTDARQPKAGLFQVAHGGTIFLDEVGLLPPPLQAKLLKATEDRAVRRLGSTRSEPIDVWIIAATSEDLSRARRTSRFREDLYHRLAVIVLRLPPLRERGEDVVLLAEHFLARACADHGLPPRTLAPDARAALLAYRWPGNVRELSNVVERAVLFSEASLLTGEALGLPGSRSRHGPSAPEAPVTPLRETVANAERQHLIEALEASEWNISRAAARLAIPRGTLRYRLEKHGLRPPDTSPVSPPGAVGGAITSSPTAVGVRWEPRRLSLLRAVLSASQPGPPSVPRRLAETLADKVQSFGGRLEEQGPVGIMAAFGLVPVEDAPIRAALAAMAIQKALARGDSGGIAIGLDTAELLVGDAAGRVAVEMEGKRTAWVALAALMEGAEPGTILVSDAAAPFLRRRFQMTPALRGLVLAGYRQVALGPEGRPAEFIGRRHELELLRDRFTAATRGQGQVMGIVGEAGIGKSRLLQEFRTRLGDEPVVWLQGHCVAYGQATSYLPVLEVLRQRFQIVEGDLPREVRDKLRQGLRRLDPNLEAALPYLLDLFGLAGTATPTLADPKQRRHKILETLRALIAVGSQRVPHVLALEDVHWIDASTDEFLAFLAEGLAGLPLLLLVTQRRGTVHWAGTAVYTQLALDALTPAEVEALAATLLGTRHLPRGFIQLLTERAEGNPLIVEEITTSLLERRALVREGDEIRWLAGAAMEIPTAVGDVTRARVDRLDGAVRQTLQTAAVIGREFGRRVLEAVSETAADVLGGHLAELSRAELICPKAVYPEEEFAFKHILFQEVVYDSIPAAERLRLHRLVGGVLEALWQDRGNEVSATLAHHFDRGRDPERALKWAIAAGDRARSVFANREALSFYDRALALADELAAGATQALHMQVRDSRGQVRGLLGDYRGAAEDFRVLRVLAQAAGDRRAEAVAQYRSAQMAVFHGRYDVAIADALEALALARISGDQATLAGVLVTLGDIQIHGIRGGDEEGVRYLEEALPLCRALGNHSGLAEALCHLGYIRLLKGDYGASVTLFDESAALARQIDDRQRLAFDLIFLGIVQMDLADFSAAERLLAQGIHTAQEIEAHGLVAVGQTFLGWVHVERENYDEGTRLLEGALATFEAAGAQGWIPLVLDIQGERLRRVGALAEARRRFEQALPLAREVGDPCWQSFALTGLAHCAGAAGNLAEARSYVEESLRLCDYKSDMWVRCRAETLATWTEVLLAHGDAAGALDVSRSLLEFAEPKGMRQFQAEARRLKGQALAALGTSAAAEVE